MYIKYNIYVSLKLANVLSACLNAMLYRNSRDSVLLVDCSHWNKRYDIFFF